MKLSDPFFDKMTQLNVRIPLRTRARLDKYQDYMQRPEVDRPPHTIDWPQSLAAIVREALDEWLSEHTPKSKPPGRPVKEKIPRETPSRIALKAKEQ